MTKQDLIRRIREQTGLDQDVSQSVVEAFFEVVKSSLREGESIFLRTFGSFIVKRRARKVARNIKKNTALVIEAHGVPFFKPSPEFIQQVKVDKGSATTKKVKN